MKRVIIFLVFGIFSCNPNSVYLQDDGTGRFSGIFQYGNFSDKIQFEIEGDSGNLNVFFTSLEQNANRISFQNIEVNGDSINFRLQSDYYTYSFTNKWIDNYRKLQGALTVDTITVFYTLEKELSDQGHAPKGEEVSFKSNGINLEGTIWYPIKDNLKAIIIVTSSGNSDRSAARGEAILFAQMGYTSFHYDKRGTGNSEGDWQGATIEELAMDDVNAIRYFSEKTNIPLANIGIKGSSQGATKIPYILGELKDLEYGIVVSCPGVSLLESDLNYWKNRHEEEIGEEIGDAVELQGKVFQYIAGILSKEDLESALDIEKSESWYDKIWVPNLDEIQIDKKLTYSPIPYFETTKQPILIIQGKEDEIIPVNSYELISDALRKAGNDNFKVVLLDGASHSMHNVGQSDFPYWSKLHPDFLRTIEHWIDSAPGSASVD